MREIEGTATISIKELDALRQREEWYRELMHKVKRLVKGLDTTEYDKKHEDIDLEDMTDKQLEKALKDAQKTIKIVVSESSLRKLIHEHIDDTKSDAHYYVSEMSEKEFKDIEIVFEKD